MTPEMKKHLRAGVVAIANEQSADAKEAFSKYLRLKAQSILVGESEHEEEDKDDDKSEDKKEDKSEDKDDDKKEDKDDDKKEDKDDDKDEEKDEE